jgi:hypothetical protein
MRLHQQAASIVLIVAALVTTACEAPPRALQNVPANDLPALSGQPFLDVTAAAGLDFIHAVGDGYMDNIIESLGSGAAWLDVDGDQDLDVYLVNQRWLEGVSSDPEEDVQSSNKLYLNAGNGTFQDVTEYARVGDQGYGFAVAAADIDNDGDQDIYVANCGDNRLYINRGNGIFDETGRRAGVADARCSAGATFFDADGDGHLDLYVANYLEFDPDYRINYAPDVYPGPLAYEAQADALYRNLGDGTFVDASAAFGIDVMPGRGMGVVSADFDLDALPDIFVANDASENFLFHNTGEGFTEDALEMGVAFGFYGEMTGAMAGAVGDIDNDGLLDILVTDTTHGSLYHNTGNALFEDTVVTSGRATLSGQWVSWGGGFFDFDNDGDLDVLQVNGDLKHPTGRPDLLLENLGNGDLQVATGGPYFARELLGRGGCFADFDNDGDIDILITVIEGPAVLLRNDLDNGNHWLLLNLVASNGSNRDAIGARVTVRAGDNEWTRFRHVPSGYLTQGDPRLHFGLGEVEQIDSVVVIWPDGQRESFDDIQADRIRTLIQGESKR